MKHTDPELIDIKAFAATPGVHLNMPEELYFSIPALGSSDLKILCTDPASWWYGSSFNPARFEDPPKTDSPKVLGSALHALLFEGEERYLDEFCVQPDPDAPLPVGEKPLKFPDGNKPLKLPLHIQNFLRANGIEPKDKKGRTLYNVRELAALAAAHGHGGRIWQNMLAKFEAGKANGKRVVSADADKRLRLMAHLVQNHPEFGPVMKMGFSEVSVIFEHPLVPEALVRARFDKLTSAFVLDLKTMGHSRGRSPRRNAIQAIVNYEYDIQRRLYHDARLALADHVAKGNIYAWEEGRPVSPLATERRTLIEIANREDWKWVWIFYQIPSNSSAAPRAPVLVPYYHEPHGQVWDQAGEKIELAFQNYRNFTEANGLDKPWAQIESVSEIDDADLASLMFKGVAK